jgi:hypothetical protein
MKWKEWLDEWSMSSLKVTAGFLEMEFKPNDVDKNAAWEMYIELLTRITTQSLPDEHGDEKTALESIYNLFSLTREVIKRNGRHCIEFTRIAIVILNQKIRPFTAKWHKLSLEGAFDDDTQCKIFRDELKELQKTLQIYNLLLANMADIEDLHIE